MNITRLILAASLAAACGSAWSAEISLPSVTLKQALNSDSMLIIAPVASVRHLMDEDSKAQGRAMRYGIVQPVGRMLVSDGTALQGQWQQLQDGRALWQLDVSSADAVSLDFQFSRLGLPDGAELYLADASGNYVLGPIRGSDALADGRYFSHLIPGDLARIEVVVPEAQRDQVSLGLAGVTYGYRGLLGLGEHPEARSGQCNIDVACPLGDDWAEQIQGVGQYIFQDGGSYVCTGTLVANTGGTAIPYFLTANHCVSTETVAQTMRIYWNYQSPTCRAPGSSDSGTPLARPSTFSNGASLRMTYSANDTSLVELNAPVPEVESPFYVGWDRRNLATPGNPQVSNAVSIHHPAGHEKRITKDDDSLTVTTYLSNTVTATGSHYRIGQWEHGTTEGGSSGSALFSPEGLLIGTLHGGYASCNSNTQDWYGRIYQSWDGGGSSNNQLSHWLDPAGIAPETFEGYLGAPLPEADLSISLDAAPNPVDIGDQVSIVIQVENLGPEDTTGVVVAVDLPVGLSYNDASPADWACSATGRNVNCGLTGTLADGDSAPALTLLADINATELGTVTIQASVSASSTDPDSDNNEASFDLEITGTPPLADGIFCSGFEENEPSCTSPVDTDLVVIEDIDFTFAPDFTGGAITWADGTTCVCDTAPYNLNVYGTPTTVQFFWPNNANNLEGGVTLDGGTSYAVLQSGASIGPSSQFLVTTTLGNASAWYSPGNVDGYLGFRFLDGGVTKYGYAHVTTGASGRPFIIHSIVYNNVGDPITIP